MVNGLSALNPDDIKKLNKFIEAAIHQFQEIEDIRGSLRDTAKGLAEEFGVKPKVLMMAARTAFKNDLQDKKDDMTVMEDILSAANA